MSGKAWMFTLFTTVSFVTIHIHYAQSECFEGDLKLHLYAELLEDHWFQIKKFSDSKEHQLLSVINTLCLTWNKNTKGIVTREAIKKNVTDTFTIMLKKLFKSSNDSEVIQGHCGQYNCAHFNETQYVNKTAFGLMYMEICNRSVSDLTCPSNNSTPPLISTNSTTSTVSTCTPPSTSANSTTFSVSTRMPPSTSANSTTSTVSTLERLQSHPATMQIFYLFLGVSLLTNILLLWLFLCEKKKNQLKNQKTETSVGSQNSNQVLDNTSLLVEGDQSRALQGGHTETSFL